MWVMTRLYVNIVLLATAMADGRCTGSRDVRWTVDVAGRRDGDALRLQIYRAVPHTHSGARHATSETTGAGLCCWTAVSTVQLCCCGSRGHGVLQGASANGVRHEMVHQHHATRSGHQRMRRDASMLHGREGTRHPSHVDAREGSAPAAGRSCVAVQLCSPGAAPGDRHEAGGAVETTHG